MGTIMHYFSVFWSTETGHVFLKILCAAGFSLIIGLERERRGQFAGAKTYMVVTVGSCLAMILSELLAKGAPGTDFTRIPSQVISGIGFLGAGAILQQGFSIKGLTTAAGLWVCAILGLVIGAGYYFYAGMATLILFCLLVGVDTLTSPVKKPYGRIRIAVKYDDEKLSLDTIKEDFASFDIQIEEIFVAKVEGKMDHVEFQLFRVKNLDAILQVLKSYDGMQSATVQML
jgi:putative Mg2+ transporter-C (MgtC) family protein